jgi:hypothetical protein
MDLPESALSINIASKTKLCCGHLTDGWSEKCLLGKQPAFALGRAGNET